MAAERSLQAGIDSAGLSGLLASLGYWSAFTLCLPQALWVRRHALRLPPAKGPDRGSVGDRAALRLYAIGDSIIAGVGVEHSSRALPALCAQALSARLGRALDWQAVGRNGAELPCLLELLRQPAAAAPESDVVLVSVGVNHVTGLGSRRRWRLQLAQLLAELRQRHPRALIVLAGIPDLARFPALPSPLRHLLGWRSRQLDRLGAELCARTPGYLHQATPIPPDPSAFAADGFHPNAEACAVWAEELAAVIAERLSGEW